MMAPSIFDILGSLFVIQKTYRLARVVELVDTRDLKSLGP